ncbi:uncharacterized protein isoform X1 [Leptinotarsa decemlineata]|uniref:uncharacterized protein isoform X1 n=1 Tax=Leptinotarsa decemlineata TaxID=7539 RepID=UPI003D308154
MNSAKINEVLARLTLEDENNWFSNENAELPNIIIEGDDIIEGENDIIDVVDDIIVEEDGGAIAVADNLQDIDGVMDPELQDEGIDDDPATDNGNIVGGRTLMIRMKIF